MKSIGNVIPVYAMVAYTGSKAIAPLTLNLDTRWWVVNFKLGLLYPWKRTLAPIEYEAVWAPSKVWPFQKRKKCLSLLGLELHTIQPVSWSLKWSFTSLLILN